MPLIDPRLENAICILDCQAEFVERATRAFMYSGVSCPNSVFDYRQPPGSCRPLHSGLVLWLSGCP